MSAYTVALDAFHGPLDLLLYLVNRDEVDVRDIPIATLADQFLAYLSALRELDIELAGDFLVTAATLMEAKARSLLPKDEAAPEEQADDPRRELVRQLLEYRRFKDAAAALEERAEKQSTRLPRTAPPEPADPSAPAVRPVEVWDLVAAFARLVRETRSLAPPTLIAADTPQRVYEDEVLARVEAGRRVRFRDLFTPPHHRARLLGLFLALLELVKRRVVGLEQPAPFDEIWVLVVESAETSEPDGVLPLTGESPGS